MSRFTSIIVSTALCGTLSFLSVPAQAATLTVTDVADNTTAGDGSCTLREAVQEATLLAGAGPFECGTPSLGGSDTIVMDAALAGATFNVVSPLVLANDDAIIIEGDDIVIDAPGLGVVFIVSSSQNVIRDLSIQNAVTGIEIESTADGTLIGGPTGADRVHINDNSTAGIKILGASNSTIRNVQIADSGTNILIEAGSTTVRVRRCVIGLDPGGVPSGSPWEIGIRVLGGSDIVIRNSFIGDNGFGAWVNGGDDVTIRSNFIGTNFVGTVARPNGSAIVVDDAGTDVTIGGASSNDGNLIAGNGLALSVLNTDGVTIQNNRIGTDVTGAVALGNTDGIILNSSLNTVIVDNTISGNGLYALSVDFDSDATITNNFIGTNAALDDLPNGVNTSVPAIWIAGAAVLSANTIAFHDTYADSAAIDVSGAGMILGGSSDNCISGNSIGLVDDSSGAIKLASNYWGDPNGPTILPLGAVFGDSIDEQDAAGTLDYSSHLAASSVPCP